MANNSTAVLGSSNGTNGTGDIHAIFNGWKQSGRDRGSIDIFWSCIVTTILCCWVSTYPNVPSVNDKRKHRFIDKLNLACIGLLGSDFLLGLAIGQFANARRSVKLFAEDTSIPKGKEWSLAHGFFADMGGFLLTSPDYPKGFPVRSEQLYYLVKHGHVDYPSLTKKDIKDMDHVDTLAKVIVVWQVTWFIVTELQRVREGLPMTTIELTALSFSFMMIVTSAFWYHKPTITRPVYISTREGRTVEEIRATARATTHPGLPQQWYRTPLYFLSGPRYWVDVLWLWHKELTYKVYFPCFGRQMRPGVWDRIPDDIWQPYQNKYLWMISGVIQTGFSISYLAGWNFYFASTPERILWRVSTCYHCAFSLFGGSYILYNELNLRKNGGHWRNLDPDEPAEMLQRTAAGDDVESSPPATKLEAIGLKSGRVKKLRELVLQTLESWRNISSDQDPELKIRMRSAWSIFGLTVIYFACRAYIYIEDFISIRSQPQGVYVTVSRFFPISAL